MTLKFRRFLYSLFILTFLIVTPLIWLYAAGYKLGSGFSIAKTGILIMDSEPEGARIYIDNKLRENLLKKFFSNQPSLITTPVKIKNLLPGEYEVRVEYDGYWSWQKKLKIEGGQSTFAEDIVLFKNDLPQNISQGYYHHLTLTPSQEHLVVLEESQVNIINLNTELGSSISWATSSALENEILFSPNENKFITNNYLFSISGDQPIDLTKALGPHTEKIIWHSQNPEKLIYQVADSLYLYDLPTKINKTLLNQPALDDFFVQDNNLYSVGPDNLNSVLSIFNLKDDGVIKKINLPRSTYEFLSIREGVVTLLDVIHNILYLIEPFSPIKPLMDTINNVTQATWINENILLFANNFEIWLYDLRTQNKTLLTRISQPIEGLFWHPTNNYIVYTTSKDINILELDKRDKYNITKLLVLEDIKSPVMTDDGETLYFYAKIGQQEGVYKLNIQ